MRQARLALAAALTLSLADAALAASGNLVVNPHFHRDLAGWNLPFPGPSTSATYNALDLAAASDSGSARLSAIGPGTFFESPIWSSCFPVTPGKYYRWKADVFIPGGQAESGVVQNGLRFATDPACASPLASTFWIDNTSTVGSVVALSGEGDAPAGVVAGQLLLGAIKTSGGSGTFSAHFDNIETVELGCDGLENDSTLCLQKGRFAVSANWRSATSSGSAGAVRLTADSGYFWFFNSDIVEVVVKVLDGCVPFQHYWVFSSGLTNLEVDLTVYDTQSQLSQVYQNALNTSYPPLFDINAFATCP